MTVAPWCLLESTKHNLPYSISVLLWEEFFLSCGHHVQKRDQLSSLELLAQIYTKHKNSKASRKRNPFEKPSPLLAFSASVALCVPSARQARPRAVPPHLSPHLPHRWGLGTVTPPRAAFRGYLSHEAHPRLTRLPVSLECSRFLPAFASCLR